MTDFFEQQEKSRKSTFGLVILYMLAVVGTCLTLHAGLCAALSVGSNEEGAASFHSQRFSDLLFNEYLALFTLGVSALIIVLASLFKIIQLSAGGTAVARAVGGREISSGTQDVKERRLLNVVEEMAIAAGVSAPRVFILDNEQAMNAFAAGFSSKDAAIAVTEGLLNVVNREELQAVIGHEFSHILNGDMRLNIQLVGVLHGIFALAILGRVLIEIALRASRGSSSSSSKKGNPLTLLALVGIVLWIVGQVGYFFGRIIQSCISRQREFLADASAVQFTRNPVGLANALKLIGATGSRLRNPYTAEVSHMLLASGLDSLFATHPPLTERIRRLDPQFDGNYEVLRPTIRNRHAAKLQDSGEEEENLVEEVLSAAAVDLALAKKEDESLGFLLSGGPAAVDPSQALSWLQPADRQSLRNIPTAIACICGSLLSDDPEIRERQMTLLPSLGETTRLLAQMVPEWSQKLHDRPVVERRKTCELAVLALRNEELSLREKVARSVQALSSADDEISPFEFALGCMIRRRLLPDESIAIARQPPLPPRQLTEDIIEVLSVIALYGLKKDQSIRPALEAGLSRMLPFIGAVQVTRVNDYAVDARRLDRALQRLQALAPLMKREFMQACEAVILHDSMITETEETFLYAIADAIEALAWNATYKNHTAA